MSYNITIEKINRKKLVKGALLVVVGVVLPAFLNVDSFHLMEDIVRAIYEERESLLIFAALKLVMLNSLRGFPHYIGAFYIGEAFTLKGKFPLIKLFKSAVVALIIPPVYGLVYLIHNIKYDFGLPALTVILILIVIGKSDYNYVSSWKKNLMIMVLFTSFQFFDIMPAFKNLPIGRGETSTDIKIVAELIDAQSSLNTIGVIFFFLLMFLGLLLLLLIKDENYLRAMQDKLLQAERIESENKIKFLQNRNFLEVNSLMHDLKSPLTSIQALVGVVKRSAEEKQLKKEVGYLEMVEGSVERISSMISEMLSDSYQSIFSTKAIMKTVLSQISISDYASCVAVENNAPDAMILVNKIRLVRAIINLIENALWAVEFSGNKVKVQIDETVIYNREYVFFEIVDKGKGIAQEEIDKIWEVGYSKKGSSGIGLSFVKDVVEKAEGFIEIESYLTKGTTITILIPKELKDERSNNFGNR